jgi:fructose-1,6-bisphosphatase I
MTKKGKAGSMNVYGESQAKMDTWADEVLVESLRKVPSVASVSSEERAEIVRCNPEGEYSIVMDPLDGSSLLDIDLTVGTIIGIHKGKDPFKKGRDLAGAVYVLYGPLTEFVYTVGNGINSFVLDKTEEYTLAEEDIRMPEGKTYSPGGLRSEWIDRHVKYINDLETSGYKLRYTGCFTADVHQILHKGGVFSYPALKDNPNGKLRVLFEAVPMGYIIEQAGGKISDGHNDILDMTPDKLDMRAPIYIGGTREIDKIEKMD